MFYSKKENKMKCMKMTALVLIIFFGVVAAGCGSSPAVVNNEATTSAILTAEVIGASEVPTASLYLQLAKEELAKSQALTEAGEEEEAASMLLRAQADGELAVALARSDTDKKEAADAMEKVQKLHNDNK